ncbi:hypothetical protein [Rhizobium esperanzae]|uniref:Uncharacterized protein n=1 Tax=Rhizobium esperanzae TaxID=1967781 RepID=A0A7W6RA28_9HYPH|nr:hypothetical protein [Rhizobium esperanzae]MBB4239245.1 hypothetical protein [Rhizobium esperanzae]
MDYELITDDDYDTLPPEPEKRFAALEKICRRNMMEIISHETSQTFDSLVRTQYMTIVTAAAEELGIDGVQYINNFDSVSDDLQEFIRITTGVTAKIRLRNSSGRDALSVKLANRTKGLIEDQLTKLKTSVAESTLSEDKKLRLLGRIEEFRNELHKERLRFGVSLAVLASIGAMVGGGTAFLADAPNAISTITHLIGVDKESEDAEILRLEGPPKPKLIAGPVVPLKGSRLVLTDDDIPF